MTATLEPDIAPRLNPEDARQRLRLIATDFDNRADDTTTHPEDRIRFAEISSAIGWALKAECGTVVLDPIKAQALDDFRARLRHTASHPNVIYNQRRLDLVLDQIAAVDHAIAQAPRRTT